MCGCCCPSSHTPCIVLFVFVEDGFSLLFSADIKSEWIIVQRLLAPFSLLGDFNPVYVMGSTLDPLDVRVATHLRVVSGTTSAPDRVLCSPVRPVEWPVLRDVRSSDHYYVHSHVSSSCPNPDFY